MPRPNLILTNEHPYHIRARSNNRDWFDLPINYCYGIFANVLPEVIRRYKIEVHAFVLMNNHFHMMVTTPHMNLSQAMCYLMTQTSKGMRVKAKRMNHVYGGRYKWSVIQDPYYYAHCFKYICRNPARAGIVNKIQDYKWSTLSDVIHRMNQNIVASSTGHDLYIPKNKSDLLCWLNEPTPKELEEAIAKGLRFKVLKISADRWTQKTLDLREGLPHVSQSIHKRW